MECPWNVSGKDKTARSGVIYAASSLFCAIVPRFGSPFPPPPGPIIIGGIIGAPIPGAAPVAVPADPAEPAPLLGRSPTTIQA